MKNLILIASIAIAPWVAQAAEPPFPFKYSLSCLDATRPEESLVIFEYTAGGLDSYGQVSFGTHDVNLICNDAVKKVSLNTPVQCVGIDGNSTLEIEVVNFGHGYSWNGIECKKQAP